MKKQLGIVVLCLVVWMALSLRAQSNTYWVDNDGAAAWVDCESASELSGASACSLTTANANAVAGDTVYLRAGTYSTSIAPANSGSSGNVILYEGYQAETATITNTGNYGIILDGDDYIKINKVTAASSERIMQVTGGADHNEIANSTLHTGTATTNSGINIWSTSATADTANTHNWFHDNTIHTGGFVNQTNCGDDGGLISMGLDSGGDFLSGFNTFEDNEIYNGSHHVLKVNTEQNVVRNNFLHNEPAWTASATCEATFCSHSGLYGNRVMNVINNHSNGLETRNLIEGNRIGWAGVASDGNGADTLTLGGKQDIARYNEIYQAYEQAVYFRTSGQVGDEEYLYNNTIAYGGQAQSPTWDCRLPPSFPGFSTGGVRVVGGANPTADAVLKNNLLWENRDGVSGAYEDIDDNGTNTVLANNWTSSVDGDPGFTDETLPTPPTESQPNFVLQPTSGAIDNGGSLTLAAGAGASSTSLTVDDSRYFQYGERGSELSNIQADTIAITTVGNTVQISSIDYATHVITLASAMTWADNDPIWLYAKSDGAVVLMGTAPDQGANESGATPETEIRLRVSAPSIWESFVAAVTAASEVPLRP